VSSMAIAMRASERIVTIGDSRIQSS